MLSIPKPLKPFSTIPFLKIILPFLVGILLAIHLNLKIGEVFYFCLLFIPLIFFNFYRAGNRYYKLLFLISADLFLIVLGNELVHVKDLRNSPNYYGKQLLTDTSYNFLAVISDLPIEKEKYIKCELSMIGIKTQTRYLNKEGSVMAYFKKSTSANKLKHGQTLLINARFSEIQEPKNPYEFNYRKYLQNKQIYHTVFVDSNSFKEVPLPDPLNNIWRFGLDCKAFVLSHLKNSPLSQNAYAICAALLTGYDDEIEKPVIDAFSHSGTLHVLSVSGLHTGLIYLVLNFLFDLIDQKRRYKMLRFTLITLFLWFFALLTGFSAPVLRAVIMFNLLGAGRIFFRSQPKNQINILLVSAFLLLCYNPFFSVDVGFLLSYFAMFGLIYYQPKFALIWQPQNLLLNYVWQSVCASFAATLSTLPITLFYFKQFPFWFFICNLFVVPATFIILILAFFVVLKINVAAYLVNYLIQALTWLIMLFNNEKGGYIDNIHFTLNDVFFLSLILILLSLATELRSYKPLTYSILLMIIWQSSSLAESYFIKKQSIFVVYHLKKESSVVLKNKTQVIHNSVEAQSYNYHVKPHCVSFNYPGIQTRDFNLIESKVQKILLLNQPKFWPATDLKRITTLVISNNFKLTEDVLQSFSNLRTIVLDGSNNKQTAIATAKLSRKFGIEFYNTHLMGAYLLPLQ